MRKINWRLTAAVLLAVAMSVGTVSARQTGMFTDSRDKQTYKTVKIGKQTWTAENLNYKTGNSWCFGNKDSNCKKYGRLYDWNTAKTACPSGWHLPTRAEWNGLVAAAGDDAAGKALKSKSGWDEDGNGTDAFGFSALPGGYRYYTGGSFGDVGKFGGWWTATENGNKGVYERGMYSEEDGVNEDDSFDKGFGVSVRCLQDN